MRLIRHRTPGCLVSSRSGASRPSSSPVVSQSRTGCAYQSFAPHQPATPHYSWQSQPDAICGYLSWIALAGLLLNALARAAWADPVTALGLLSIIINDAKESFQGCSCDCS